MFLAKNVKWFDFFPGEPYLRGIVVDQTNNLCDSYQHRTQEYVQSLLSKSGFEHAYRLIAERTNAFVTLVFGYSVVALLYQNKAPYGINAYGIFFQW